MNSQMRDLPYDVWEYVTTFLSSQETKKLLDINRTLFNIAMNERYRNVTIGSLIHQDTRRNLDRLTDPDVACRARRLIFKPGDICRALEEKARKNAVITEAPKTKKKIRSIMRQDLFSRKRMKGFVNVYTRIPVEEAVQNIMCSMAQLRNLTSLLVDLNTVEHWSFGQAAVPFFDIGWSTFRTSLRRLELRVPVEDLALILPTEPLPNLDTVSLRLIRASVSTHEENIIINIILPFLQLHLRTLRSLDLDVAERTNLSPLLLVLSLPSLKHFKLIQPYFDKGEADYTGLKRFLKTHRYHLISLEIGIGYHSIRDTASLPYPFFSQACFTVPLPNLERLCINYSFSETHGEGVIRDSVVNYVHQFKKSLLSLKFGPAHSWALRSVKILVEGFISTARLRRLEISVVFFEPELLTILAANLPNLEFLNIGLIDVSPHGDDGNSVAGKLGIPLFAKEIRALFFPQWRLRSLNLHITNLGIDAITAIYLLEREDCKSALLQALPNVETFCGLSRDEYYAS